MANFLWAGPDLMRKMHSICWDVVCKPSAERGLNIKRIKEMNDACILKHLWWIISKKENLWVRWVYRRYLKRDLIWTFRPPNDSSWIWRKWLKVRDVMEPNVLSIIGNGIDTKLWLDKWHCEGVLVKRFGENIRHLSGLNRNCNVSSILVNGSWSVGRAANTTLPEAWAIFLKSISYLLITWMPLCGQQTPMGHSPPYLLGM